MSTPQDLRGRRIALIGGAGFIGHNMAIRLKELGADVRVLDSLAVNNYYSLLERKDPSPNWGFYLSVVEERLALLEEHDIPLVEVDSRNYHHLSQHLGAFRPDSIVHLAAVAHAGKSNKDPYSTFGHSLLTLENALDYSRPAENEVRNFIYFSSSMVYGHFPPEGVTEETPCSPLGIYGSLKYAGEKMVIAYGQVFDLPYTIIRPSALYGRRCISRRVGQLFIEKALANEKVTVHGDGSDRLDFTYIDDLVAGIVCVLNSPEGSGEIFNLTYGESRSLADMVALLRDEFPDVEVEFLPKDKLTPDRGTLEVGKAKRLLGYAPAFPLERGFRDYIAWYKDSWDRLIRDRSQPPRRAGTGEEPELQFATRDAFLGAQVGRPTYRVRADPAMPETCGEGGGMGHAAAEELSRLEGFLYTKVPTDDPDLVAYFEDLGFRVVDTNVQLERVAGAPAEGVTGEPGTGDSVGPATPQDREAVGAVAEASFSFSRLHLDPRVPKSVADGSRAAWATNYFSGERGDAMVVARHEGEVVGFLQLLRPAGDRLVIDLIAVHPEHRGRGLAAAMIQHAEADLVDPGGTILVGTQVSNIPSLRLYDRLGFRMKASSYVLHRHPSKP